MCTIILRESASPNQNSCEGGCATCVVESCEKSIARSIAVYASSQYTVNRIVRAVRGW